MPKGSAMKRAFRLKTLLERGVTIPEIMKEFGIKKASAQRMRDQIGDIFPVVEAGYRHTGGPPAIIYRLLP